MSFFFATVFFWLFCYCCCLCTFYSFHCCCLPFFLLLLLLFLLYSVHPFFSCSKKKTAFCSLILLVLPLRYTFNALLPLYRTSYTTCVFLRPALVSLLSYSAFPAFSFLLFSFVFICCVWRKSVHAQGEGGHIQKGVSQHQQKDEIKKKRRWNLLEYSGLDKV